MRPQHLWIAFPRIKYIWSKLLDINLFLSSQLYIRSNFIFSLPESLKHLLLLSSCSVVSYPLQLHGLQHARLACPSLSPRLLKLRSIAQTRVHWCHPTISSSVAPFSFCLQSFPASGSFLASKWAYFSGLTFIWLDKENSLNLPSIFKKFQLFHHLSIHCVGETKFFHLYSKLKLQNNRSPVLLIPSWIIFISI